ncbi:MAG: alpha/beta fold hydrolase [Jatrophihabitantaceae bacterium]
MTTFALVHGAWHGAWCWERLVPELATRGHRVITMDLPCDAAGATFETYADVVCGALAAHASDDVVVVGHSLAGLTIPLVAARRPVSRLVYLCALVPSPGRSFVDQLSDEDDDMLDQRYLAGLSQPDAERRRAWVDEVLAREVLFADCDAQTSRAAFERLRPQSPAPYARACALDELPPAASTYIVCSADRLVNPAWSRRAARQRLDADLVELPGSHSPFLSRPAELAGILHELG